MPILIFTVGCLYLGISIGIGMHENGHPGIRVPFFRGAYFHLKPGARRGLTT